MGALDFRKLGLGGWILENGVYGVGGFFFGYFYVYALLVRCPISRYIPNSIQEHWRFQVLSDLFW